VSWGKNQVVLLHHRELQMTAAAAECLNFFQRDVATPVPEPAIVASDWPQLRRQKLGRSRTMAVRC
jgi:hypothetical protein